MLQRLERLNKFFKITNCTPRKHEGNRAVQQLNVKKSDVCRGVNDDGVLAYSLFNSFFSTLLRFGNGSGILQHSLSGTCLTTFLLHVKQRVVDCRCAKFEMQMSPHCFFSLLERCRISVISDCLLQLRHVNQPKKNNVALVSRMFLFHH